MELLHYRAKTLLLILRLLKIKVYIDRSPLPEYKLMKKQKLQLSELECHGS